ncbi:MAG TPA: tetratricopeptide repeat protein [Polyangia bacterium]
MLWLTLLPSLGAVAHAQGPGSAAASGEAVDKNLDAEAKRLFTSGRYAEAIELLNRLYRETNNPIYLRNLGRSYQRMGDPDRAITNFEEYLRRGRNLSAGERDEVRGFIREMKALKRESQAAGPNRPAPLANDRVVGTLAPAPTPPSATVPAAGPQQPVPPPPASTSSPIAAPAPFPTPAPQPPMIGSPPPVPWSPPVAGPGPATATDGGSLADSSSASTAPAQPLLPSAPQVVGDAATGGRNVGRTVGIVVTSVAGALAAGGTVALMSSRSAYRAARAELCGQYQKDCEPQIRTVEKRNLISKILFASAAATGLLGVGLIVLSPTSQGQSQGQGDDDGRIAGLMLSTAGRF